MAARCDARCFDEPKLLAAAVVPVVALTGRVGLRDLTDEFLLIQSVRGATGIRTGRRLMLAPWFGPDARSR